MADTVRARAGHSLVRAVGVSLARRTLPRDVPGQVRMIYDYLSEHVHFVDDPLGLEYVGDPVRMLQEIEQRFYITGDCDDVAVLGAALGASIGIAPRFVVLAFHEPGAPMAHVYAELFDGRAWRDLDTTRTIPEVQRVQSVSREWIIPIY